jgi:hypothetical protein
MSVVGTHDTRNPTERLPPADADGQARQMTMPAGDAMTAGASWAPAVDQCCVFDCYSVVLQLSRPPGGSSSRRLSKGQAPRRVWVDEPVGRLTVVLRPGGEEGGASVRHDPGILAGASGDEARATSRAVGRLVEALRLLVHHALFSVSLWSEILGPDGQKVGRRRLQMHRLPAVSSYD